MSTREKPRHRSSPLLPLGLVGLVLCVGVCSSPWTWDGRGSGDLTLEQAREILSNDGTPRGRTRTSMYQVFKLSLESIRALKAVAAEGEPWERELARRYLGMLGEEIPR